MKRFATILMLIILLFSVSFAQVTGTDMFRDLKAVLTLIDEGQTAKAASAFAGLNIPDATSPAMAEFVRGRLALAGKKYPQALQHFSNVIVFHSRDPEWMPAATFYEGVVYKRTGYLTAASNIVEELEMAYPNTVWSARAAELK